MQSIAKIHNRNSKEIKDCFMVLQESHNGALKSHNHLVDRFIELDHSMECVAERLKEDMEKIANCVLKRVYNVEVRDQRLLQAHTDLGRQVGHLKDVVVRTWYF